MIFLEDLMNQPDFCVELETLISEYRDKFSLPKIYQLGLVVEDVEAAALYLEEQGIDTFFIAAGSPALWLEKGEKRSFRGKLGRSYHHGVELELIEPGEGSDIYKRCLDPEGRIVVQHLAFYVDDVDAWAKKLGDASIKVLIRGVNKLGPMDTQFVYMDTEKTIGIIIEFISRKFFGLDWWPLDPVFKVVARFQKWTGKRSLAV